MEGPQVLSHDQQADKYHHFINNIDDDRLHLHRITGLFEMRLENQVCDTKRWSPRTTDRPIGHTGDLEGRIKPLTACVVSATGRSPHCFSLSES